MPTASKRLTKKQYAALSSEEKKARRDARMKEATSSFEEALATLTNGETFREYLASTALCHNYSLRNTIWVMWQRGSNFVPPIASYETWKSKLGYQVRKGERGAQIWVPAPVKIEDENGEERTIMRFKTGKVFTRDQVDPIEGKALSIDPPASEPVTGDSHQPLIGKLKGLAEERGYEVNEIPESDHTGAEGYHDKTSKVIAYRPDRPANSIVRVLIHELIHSYGISYETYGRNRSETITDSATYLACRMVGLDVEKASIPYVAGWGNRDVDTIANDLALMQRLANQIIDDANLEAHLALSEADTVMRRKSGPGKASETA